MLNTCHAACCVLQHNPVLLHPVCVHPDACCCCHRWCCWLSQAVRRNNQQRLLLSVRCCRAGTQRSSRQQEACITHRMYRQMQVLVGLWAQQGQVSSACGGTAPCCWVCYPINPSAVCVCSAVWL